METKEIEEWIKTKGKVEIAECPHIDPVYDCPFCDCMNSVSCYGGVERPFIDWVTHICNMKSVLASEAETQAVLADKELMVQIEESRKNPNSRDAEELFKELGI